MPQMTAVEQTPLTDVTLSPFNSREHSRLEQIQRFLVQIVERDIAPRAALVGYDSAEHALGWESWHAAAGASIPFGDYLDEMRQKLLQAGSSVLQEQMRQVDLFENTWFPRARNAIRRFLDPAERETFEQAFFADMSQQPLGPGVFASVEKFLGRLEGLKTSTVQGAQEVYASLQKKGLSDSVLAAIRTVLSVQKQLDLSTIQHDTATKLAAIAASRRQAYQQLNLWYIDWAETLRSVLSYQQLVRMGLTSSRGGRSRSATEPEQPEQPEQPELPEPGAVEPAVA